MSLEGNALSYLKENESVLVSLAKDIWDHPQLAFEETYASKLIADQLEKAAFSVQRGVAQVPTAFIASWGEGKPIIGILGEYDALPGLSQNVSAEKEPVKEGGPGHGCGHNLLGIGSLGAVLATKGAMESDNVKGTIRYYGCPAEETLMGKVFMAQAGLFSDLDAAITWHPRDANTVGSCAYSAVNSFKLNFHGISSHAAAAPEMGRSALDGILLTDVGVNYLREHAMQESRIHCVITNGGLAPNIVPSYAQAWYMVRAPRRDQVDDLYQRVLEIARGAALMTGTSFDVEFIAGCYDYLPNVVVEGIILEKLKGVGPPRFTNDERDFAKRIVTTLLSTIAVENALDSYGLRREEIRGHLCNKVLDRVGAFARGRVKAGSTDVGNVSYITPTGQFNTCCRPFGVPGHTWQVTAVSGSTIGFKGMMVAAKTMALAALDLVTKPNVLRAAREEFNKATRRKKYVSPLLREAIPGKSVETYYKGKRSSTLRTCEVYPTRGLSVATAPTNTIQFTPRSTGGSIPNTSIRR